MAKDEWWDEYLSIASKSHTPSTPGGWAIKSGRDALSDYQESIDRDVRAYEARVAADKARWDSGSVDYVVPNAFSEHPRVSLTRYVSKPDSAVIRFIKRTFGIAILAILVVFGILLGDHIGLYQLPEQFIPW
jgi:hypothetical protein